MNKVLKEERKEEMQKDMPEVSEKIAEKSSEKKQDIPAESEPSDAGKENPDVSQRYKQSQIRQLLKAAAEESDAKASDNKVLDALKTVISLAMEAGEAMKVLNRNNLGIGKDVSTIPENIKDLASGFGAFGSKILTCQWISLGLEAMNLAVTWGGFIHMNETLREIGDRIDAMAETLGKVARKEDMSLQKEYREVRADYIDMLDGEKRNIPFGEERQYELTRKLADTISYLYDCFMQDAGNPEILLNAIYVLLPMFANVLCRYDRTYYFKYYKDGNDAMRMHMLHKEWVSVIRNLRSRAFLDKLNEYCFLDKGMHTRDAMHAVNTTYMMALAAEVSIDDNQKIIDRMHSMEEYNQYSAEKKKEAAEDILNASKKLSEEQMNLIRPVLKNIQAAVSQI